MLSPHRNTAALLLAFFHGPGLFASLRIFIDRFVWAAVRLSIRRDGRQKGRREPLVETGDRHVAAQLLIDPGHDSNRQQGMPAEIEKVVMDADLVDAEQLLPHLADLPLGLAT